MSTAIVAADEDHSISRKTVMLVAILWAALLTVPLWLPLLGGYTALAGRVLVFGLAAMGLNMLLGFTGVLSFGHAAYFGLGAYGAGLTLKYVAHSTPLAILAGTLLGGIAGTTWGLLRSFHQDEDGIETVQAVMILGLAAIIMLLLWNLVPPVKDWANKEVNKLKGLNVSSKEMK